MLLCFFSRCSVAGCGDLATEPEPRASGDALKGETHVVSGEPDGDGHPNVGVLAFDLDGPDGPVPPIALCGGFVASNDVFVTAAHCIAVAPDAAWTVTLEPGSPDDPVVQPGIFPEDVPFPVLVDVVYADEVVMHPRFGEGHSQAHDVAVLVFPEGPFAYVDPVQLPEVGALDEFAARGGLRGQEFTLVGYGMVPISRGVQEKVVPGFRQVDEAMFQALSRDWLHLQATTEATGEGGLCTGDSGSPQFLGDTNVAVSLLGGKGIEDPCGTGVDGAQRLDTPAERDFLADHVDLP